MWDAVVGVLKSARCGVVDAVGHQVLGKVNQGESWCIQECVCVERDFCLFDVFCGYLLRVISREDELLVKINESQKAILEVQFGVKVASDRALIDSRLFKLVWLDVIVLRFRPKVQVLVL